MRAGLSTIQQTLTPEAATVLNHSIAEAGRRNHGQTTPLHVAATLLSSPSGFLRQACIRSHPNSSHPLQCRALELCFSVALERLPTAHNTSPAMEPPISNALMAALKRAQAHQRRGCPEQQQQPLLAVKVELEQLIISILDDPSVSRVMREASFSSPAVKATIEQSMNSPPATSVNPSIVGLGFRPSPTPMAMPNRNLPVKSTIEQSLNSQATSVNQSSKVGPGFRPTPTPMVMPNRNLYLNPRLQQGNSVQSGQQMNEEVKRVIDILLRTKKRNPVLVGDSEPEAVIKELLRRIEKGEFGGGPLENVQVIPLEKELSLDKTQIPTKLKELGGVIESRIGNSNGGGVILDLGDLKWLVEQPVSLGVPGGGGLGQQVVSERGRAAVAEMGKLVMEGSNGRIWLIGTATCETYLRCQVYHPSMENDWDLQAVPIASKSPLPGMFPRLGTNGIISSSVGSLIPLKSFPTATTALPRRVSENSDPARRMGCCPQCTENYQKELAKLSEDSDKSSSEVKSDSSQPSLPQWLRDAKLHNSDVKSTDQLKTKDEEMIFKQKSQELHKKWSDTCMNIHPNFHRNLSSSERTTPTALSMTGLYNPNLLLCQNFNPTKLQQTKNIGLSLQLNPNSGANQPGSPPRSPVRTELVLGQTKISETSPEKTHEERVKDLPGCISSEPQTKFNEWKIEKFANSLDADEFKQLLKGLMEKVWWQKEAVSAVATSITRCKLGNGKQRAAGTKGDIWLLFTGPDRVGKKKMASVLSEQAGGGNPVIICLGSRRDDEESDFHFRGKTVLDRIAEAVRRNPFSVIMLQDIDEANMLVRGSIKRAMERGRLADSHGREISLGNIIFILTANSDDLNTTSGNLLDENKLASVASGGWQLRLSLSGKSAKRRANWLFDEDRATRPRKELGSGLSFDLNEVADTDDHKTDGSHDSSDLTVDHEDELDLENRQFAITSVPHELATFLDDAIIFNPVQIRAIRREIKNAITKKFFSILDDKLTIEVQDEALEKIVGGVWLGQTSLEDWAEKVLVPSFNQLKSCLSATILTSSCENMVIRLEPDSDSETRNSGDWLPSKITVMVNGV